MHRTSVDYVLDAPSVRKSYAKRVLTTRPDRLIQFLPLDDPAASTRARDLSPKNSRGWYQTSGITFGEVGPTVGEKSVALSGADTYVQPFRSGQGTFATDFDGDVGSAIAWAKVDGAARWTDAVAYRYPFHVRTSDNTYYVTFGKTQTSNQLMWRRRSGGANCEVNYTWGSAPTDWFCMGMTWDITVPRLVAYLWHPSVGFVRVGESTSASLTSFGANVPMDGNSTHYAGSLTLQEWIGWGAMVAIWAGVALTDAQMQRVMRP